MDSTVQVSNRVAWDGSFSFIPFLQFYHRWNQKEEGKGERILLNSIAFGQTPFCTFIFCAFYVHDSVPLYWRSAVRQRDNRAKAGISASVQELV